MPDRQNLVATFWISASLILLASELVAPIQPSGCCTTASDRPDSLRSSFTLPPGQPTTRLGTAIAADGDFQINGLPVEREEQDRADAYDEPQISFRIPCSLLIIPDRQAIACLSVPSHYPLRC